MPGCRRSRSNALSIPQAVATRPDPGLSSERLPWSGIRDFESRHAFFDWIPALGVAAVAHCALGFYLAFVEMPVHPGEGVVHRILFLHVPATWVAVMLYLAMAILAAAGRWRPASLAPMGVQAIAPTGALFAFLALWTGSLWSKPISGSWLVSDMLSANIALAVLYIAVMAAYAVIECPRRADRVAAWIAVPGLAVVGTALYPVAIAPRPLANVVLRGTQEGASQLLALGVVAMGLCLYAAAIALIRLRCVILEREREREWEARHPSGSADD